MNIQPNFGIIKAKVTPPQLLKIEETFVKPGGLTLQNDDGKGTIELSGGTDFFEAKMAKEIFNEPFAQKVTLVDNDMADAVNPILGTTNA